MKNLVSMMLLAVLLLSGCVEEGFFEEEEEKTTVFRAALVAEEDVRMRTPGDNSSHHLQAQGESSDYAGLAWATAETVVGTNHFMLKFIVTMHYITNLPPAVAEEDLHIWEGTHEDLFIRVSVERSDDPQGTRFDYEMEGRYAEDGEDGLVTILDGYVVRKPGWSPQNRIGFGIVRHDYDNLNYLQPEREISGFSSVGFRRAGGIHQLEVRALDIVTPAYPDYPERAAYRYFIRGDHSGELLWQGRADWKGDGEPLEDVAAHVSWNSDFSGAGLARVSGGTLEVDYWNIAECWDGSFLRSYGKLEAPNANWSDGDDASCSPTDPDGLAVPIEADLPGDEAVIPQAHPDEQ